MDIFLPVDYPIPGSNPLSPRSKLWSPLKAGFFDPDSDSTLLGKGQCTEDRSTVLRLLSAASYLHCRPSGLNLGAETWQKQLRFKAYWDGNVYADDVVKEWLDEVKAATEWYLGGGRVFGGNAGVSP
jgi:hypothetical protein